MDTKLPRFPFLTMVEERVFTANPEGRIFTGMKGQPHPLPDMLEIAVPLWILQLEQLSDAERWERQKRWAHEAEEVMQETGEAILYRVEGKSARAFNAVAQAVAALAYMPDGVTLFGRTWRAGVFNKEGRDGWHSEEEQSVAEEGHLQEAGEAVDEEGREEPGSVDRMDRAEGCR